MSFLFSGLFSLFFMEDISEQGDSFLFCEIRRVGGELSWGEDEILDLDVDDEEREYNEEDSEEDENVIFTSEFFS